MGEYSSTSFCCASYGTIVSVSVSPMGLVAAVGEGPEVPEEGFGPHPHAISRRQVQSNRLMRYLKGSPVRSGWSDYAQPAGAASRGGDQFGSKSVKSA